ncbi:MAG: NAD(P)-dependent alcohol dehydrogenase [Gammaproteobacteria bacterium]
MKIRAALATANDSPLTIDEVELDAPAAGEVLVRVVATGMCHTDLHMLASAPLPWPAIFGHEGAGIVESVGPGVSAVSPGDRVIMTTSSCGTCGNCSTGLPSYCLRFVELNVSGGYRADGSCSHRHRGKPVFARFLGQSSFATHVLTGQRNVVKVDADLPLDLLAPLGCGIQTGAGAVLNTLGAKAGASIAIFGAGAVGLSALMAAGISGCMRRVVVDKVPSRLALARELGATHVIDAGQADAVPAVREATGGGADYAVEATGVAEVMAQAIAALGYNGAAALVGVAGTGASVAFDPGDVQARNLTIRGSMMAGVGGVPEVFIPRLIGYWRAGLLPIEKLVRHYEFSAINQAIHDSHDGSAIKPILRMPA